MNISIKPIFLRSVLPFETPKYTHQWTADRYYVRPRLYQILCTNLTLQTIAQEYLMDPTEGRQQNIGVQLSLLHLRLDATTALIFTTRR